MTRRIYADLTPSFLAQALAQDIANVTVASPAMLLLATLAMQGSLHPYLLMMGVVTFTVYNYLIYTFSVPFGQVFASWVTVLGYSIYGLITGLRSGDHAAVLRSCTSGPAVVVVALVLMLVAILFALLCLSEDIPASLAGKASQILLDLNVPTNPVHVLDMTFFLPAAKVTGVFLLRLLPLAYTIAPVLLVFLVMPGVSNPTQSGSTAASRVAFDFGLIVLVVWLVSTVRTTGHAA